MATTSPTIRPTTAMVVLLALVASLVGPLAPAADAAGETVFGANPSSASGPGTIASDKPDGTNETYRLVARATNVDGTERVVALIDDGDSGTTANGEPITLRLVDGTPDTYAAEWDIPSDAQSGAGRVTFQVLDGTTVLAEERIPAKIEPETYSVAITSPTTDGSVDFPGGSQTIEGTASSDADAVALYYSTSPAGVAPTWTKCGDVPTTAAGSQRAFSGTCTLDGASPDDVTLIGGQASLTGSQGSGDVVRVNPNAAPDAVNDAYATDEDVTLTVDEVEGVLANDTDADGHTLTASHVTGSGPSDGTLTLDADGSFTYVPDANFNGTDSFQYEATDELGSSDVATVTITVNEVNDTPVANDDSYTTDEDTTLAVTAPGILGNDSDVDGDDLTVSLVSGSTNGTLTGPNADGSFTYVPDADYAGPDSFTYGISDGTASDTAVVSITVGAVNDAPVATDDAYSTAEDTPRTVTAPGGVLDNDSDPENDTLSASLVTDVTNGTLVLNTDGSFSYTPALNFNGTDSFTYRASDGSLQSEPATVTITVSPVNDAPAATGDPYGVDEDQVLSVAAPGVLGNDSDVDDGDALTAVLVDDVTDGILTLNADGSFTYTPDADFHGTDSFTYQASDGEAQSNTVTVTITVNPINDAPVAQDDQYDADEDQPLNVAAPGVLADDSDPDGDALTAVLVSNVTNGSLTLNPDGSFSYTPDLNFDETDSFTYRANDGTVDSNLATVTIDVSEENDEPVAVDDSASTNEDEPVGGNVLDNDSDPDAGDTFTAELATGPSNGTVVLDEDGSYTYTPDANFVGIDTFTYQADDGDAESNAATVTITVHAVNDAPVANDDSYSAAEGTTRTVAAAEGVLDNDTDVEGDALFAAKTSDPANGTVTLHADGSFTYTPAPNFNGDDSFTYRADDDNGGTDEATVTITVNPVNDPPVAADDAATTDEDTAVTITVLANDSDIDGDPLTVTPVGGPANGTAAVNDDGTFTYTPHANFHGTDEFTYQANDGAADSNVATVTITVDAVNDAPAAVDDDRSTEEDTKLSVAAPGVLGNDSDVEGSPLTAVLVEGVANGTLKLNANGSFTYTPKAHFHGTDTFTYRADDGSLSSNVATVTITVTPVNDAPVAADDTASTDEDEPVGGNVLTNDRDPDGDTLRAAPVSGPSDGAVTLKADGTFTYTPDPGFSGTDRFTYRASDGSLSDTAAVDITVRFGTEVDDIVLEHRVTRLWGEDRFATAVDTSRNSFPEDGSADVVVLARGDDPSGFADALAGTPLAVDRNGPLLITMPDSLHPATEAELRRALPPGSTVIMLGLTAALHPAVEDRVEALGYDVQRIGGVTRMETAIGIAGELGHPGKLLIARGFDFPDALAAGAAAAHVDGAVLLGDDGRRNPSTEDYLDAHPDAEVWAIGGQMARLYPEATPVFGFDRVETAVAVADEFFVDPPVIGLARMDKFPDSLTGGAHIGRLGGPMLLTHPAPTEAIAPQVKEYVCGNEASIFEAYVYGGSLALSLGVEQELLQRIMGSC